MANKMCPFPACNLFTELQTGNLSGRQHKSHFTVEEKLCIQASGRPNIVKNNSAKLFTSGAALLAAYHHICHGLVWASKTSGLEAAELAWGSHSTQACLPPLATSFRATGRSCKPPSGCSCIHFPSGCCGAEAEACRGQCQVREQSLQAAAPQSRAELHTWPQSRQLDTALQGCLSLACRNALQKPLLSC